MASNSGGALMTMKTKDEDFMVPLYPARPKAARPAIWQARIVRGLGMEWGDFIFLRI
jgi:hypothetical protein